MKMILILLICLVNCANGTTCNDLPLNEFLMNDSTDKHEYHDEYRCGNFSRDLVLNASHNGLHMGTILVGRYPALNGTDNHAMCWIKIDDKLIIIEPQSDEQMTLEDIDKKYSYYLLFPAGKMVASSWECEYSAKAIRSSS